ncbi:SIS domain-containing protein [Thorsellia anophelis]|uniref:Transcriptional regulator, RpiR family n=1 Tax=Thorsellia anophelis DSM 18579 TaxID=1123402 RepID=A0A1I0DD54_9GAMM|nr:SIS domain-containing protein [Thorsellia anophelis]SET30264.1 transcriptional regulator, RpiR family [Thorsellia anophelis DSM 18579]
MSILTKISLNQSSFSPNEKKIAEFILANSEVISSCSSQHLAEQAQVSQSSIVKFVQKIGFKGFVAFRLALSQELGRKKAITNSFEANNQQSNRLHNTITKDDGLPNIIKKLLQEKNNAVIETSNALEIMDLENVVNILNEARNIQIVGIGGSGLVAKDFASKLLKIGCTAICEIDPHTQLTIAQTLSYEDVQIVISYSGQRNEIKTAASLAKKRGAKVIGITSLHQSPLRSITDYNLTTIAEEEEWRSSSISSRTAQHTVTDLLFMALLQKKEDIGKRLIEDAHKVILSL